MAKTDRTVVRNQSYQKNGIGIRERHNERKNENYSNPDIVLSRTHMNIQFCRSEGTYTHTLDRMIADGTVSMRGLQADAKVFEEMVFDVNTAYFDDRGGYDYAADFFYEAFCFAEKEVGSRYILSAVMHADEKNRALSEELGRDVYHYHLHVIYIPVVEKEIRWTKRCKDKALVGTVKKVIHQISHSKKWAFPPLLDEQGNPILSASGKIKRISSYSLLQDRFFEHMRDAGYEGFERGVRGSTDKHLSTLDYKIQQDTERLNGINQKIKQQQNELSDLDGRIKSATAVKSELYAIDKVGKKKLFGKVELTETEYTDVTTLAREGIGSRSTIENLQQRLSDLQRKHWGLTARFNELLDETQEIREAARFAPQTVKEFCAEIVQKAKEERLGKIQHCNSRYRGRENR
jgi:hypothetical protein